MAKTRATTSLRSLTIAEILSVFGSTRAARPSIDLRPVVHALRQFRTSVEIGSANRYDLALTLPSLHLLRSSAVRALKNEPNWANHRLGQTSRGWSVGFA